ncbi:S8 family peptidase [Allokutzneria oryzae]|uniref:S8 family serine peptidase n=1 Tax=Allokutzneria oryzae TaxID=1378989 RepID=A0ABV6AAH1_9PSEU
MHRRRPLVGLVTVAALATLGVGAPASAAPADGSAPTTPATTTSATPTGRTVTLITGDRVHVDAEGVPLHTEAGPGRSGTRFTTSTRNGHHHVVPEDAKAQLESGRLDRRLFDITLLIQYGYEDSKVGDIPLLLAQGTARSAPVVPNGSRRSGQVSPLGLVSMRTNKSEATTTWNQLRGPSGARTISRADKVWLNGKMSYSLDKSVPLTGAPAAWQAGYTAKDVTVAVLDSGVDTTHPDLTGVVAKDFSGSKYGTKDLIGHGTHVTSTVGGTGAASGGKYAGMTKGAKLLLGKVGDFDVTDEAALAAMAWASVENKAKVVNMSFGGEPGEESPLDDAIERLTKEQGTLFVVAAGNNGKDGGVGTPGTTDAALAVASSTKSKQLSEFSSRGPRYGDHAVKPDITGPGSEIVAAKAEGKAGAAGVPERYTVMDGTSMAAPHLTGAAAILAGQHPDWSPGRIKATLMNTAKPIDGTTVYGQGAGLVDLAKATAQTLTADQGSLSLGYFTWPHNGQEPSTKDITYRNDGDKPVTAKLELSTSDKEGKPGDSGQFRLSANEVTVPAKGTAKVSVTVDPTKRPGLYGGWLTATAGDTVVRTAVGAHVEGRMHVINVKATGLDGKPAEPMVTVVGLHKDSTFQETVEIDANGVGKARLPAGDYMVTSEMYEDGPRGTYPSDPLALVHQVAPKIHLDADTTLDIDARKAKPMRVELDDPSMKIIRQDVRVLHGTGGASRPCCVSQRAAAFTDSDTPVLLGTLGGDDPGFRHITNVTAVKPEVTSEIVAPQRVPLNNLSRDSWSPKLVGEHRMTVVDGKRGRAEDLSGLDLKGKLVLLTLDPKADDTAKAVQAVADAGGKAALVVQPARGVFAPMPIPVFNAAEHRLTKLVELLAAGQPVELNLVGAKDSPVSYDVAMTSSGTMPDGGTHQVRKQDLVKIDASYHKDGANFGMRPHLRPQLDGPSPALVPISHPFRAPAPVVELGTTRTEYVSPGWWKHELGVVDKPANGYSGNNRYDAIGSTKITPDGPHRMDFNSGPFGPAIGTLSFGRAGNMIVASPTMFAPRASGTTPGGWSNLSGPGGQVTLSRNGKEIGKSDNGSISALVPEGKGRYEVTAKASREAKPGLLGTSAEATWTFTSGRTGKQGYEQLPVLVLDPRLTLDVTNAAPAGAPLPIEVLAGQHPMSPSKAKVTELRLSVSYDDGATWVDVPVRQNGERWQATLPVGGKAGGHGSLRISAKDSDGSTVAQTVLRAYALS